MIYLQSDRHAKRKCGGDRRPTPLPMQTRFGHYPAGEFIGVLAAPFPDMTDSAAIEAAAMFASPVAVSSAEPPSTSGDPSGGHVTLAQFTGRSPSAAQTPKATNRRDGAESKALVWLRCAYDFAHLNTGLGLGLTGCAAGSAMSGPAAPVSAPVCYGIVGGLLGPPTAVADYALISKCVQESEH